MPPLLTCNPPSLALCCIVKNEAQNLRRCLESVQDHVDRLVVVDTGSEDETLAIAKSYGATVGHFEWCNDFAAARNYSLSLVNSDWILMLDADEEWVVQDPNWRQQLVSPMNQFAVIRHDLFEAAEIVGGHHLRLFRNIPGMQFQGRYHEQLCFPDAIQPLQRQLQGAYIKHHGNSDENIRLKNRTRDIPILEQMRHEGSIDLWRLDCLARKYIKVGQHSKAQDCYQEILDRLTPNLLEGHPPQSLFWIPTILDALGSQALEQEDLESARLLCMRGLEWFPTFPPLNYLAGELMMQLGFPLAAKSYFEACLEFGKSGEFYQEDPCPVDFMQVFPACALAWSYHRLGQHAEAQRYVDLALSYQKDYAPALELRQLLASSTSPELVPDSGDG
ncbi:tetratricopeptide repeat-containing glycosyltransferase family 2 protein [Lyngbya confervoides]|uniref:Glycosyltransferase n=1 Tax=Lyngbya confervoides BDU141951 TaxID=1574623 RepID=A0ABD4T9Y4_9CYAN|nr:glycosyltransferase [Lyngbya confervoides]MCM1985243.1 glycosyltransferase [Lyngbya confervoides BDU141951]